MKSESDFDSAVRFTLAQIAELLERVGSLSGIVRRVVVCPRPANRYGVEWRVVDIDGMSFEVLGRLALLFDECLLGQRVTVCYSDAGEGRRPILALMEVSPAEPA